MNKEHQKQTPYKLLLNNSGLKNGKRSTQQIETMSELLLNNRIFSYLNLAKNSIRQLCNQMVLIWTDNPHILETANHQVYFILEGKAFQYMQNRNIQFKAKIQQDNDYLMVRKLLHNDFFIVFSPEARYADQGSFKKYQIMVDQGTLIGKIEGELYQRLLLPLIEERSRKISSFLRQIQMFNYLPQLLMHELSRYMEQITIPSGTKIIKKQQKNPYVYFIQSGEIEFRTYNPQEGRQSPSKNYRTSYEKQYRKITMKENNLFGIDAFNAETYEEQQSQYSAQSKTNCLLYKVQKRILAIVISSFEETFRKRSKIMNNINLNDQIQGQGYQNEQIARLTRNASMIRTSDKKIRDIKLRFFQTSERKRAALGTAPFYENLPDKDQPQTLLDIKYQSCQNFASVKVNKQKNKKFYQTMNARFNQFPETTQKKVNQIVLSAYNQPQKQKQPIQSPSKRSRTSFHIKRKSEIKSSGKEQSDVLRAFKQKKLQDDMMKKAENIIERKIRQNEKKKIQIKRLFSQKLIRSKSQCQPKAFKKQIQEELLQKMNKIDQYPLVNLIEGERKKLQSQAKRILEAKLRTKQKDHMINTARISRNPIVIQDN